jgi:hypothetical protein
MYLAEVCILFEIPFFQAFFMKYILWNTFVDSNIYVRTEIKIVVFFKDKEWQLTLTDIIGCV